VTAKQRSKKNLGRAILALLLCASSSSYASVITFDDVDDGVEHFTVNSQDISFSASFSKPTRESASDVFSLFGIGGLYIGASSTVYSFEFLVSRDVYWTGFHLLRLSDYADVDLGVSVSGLGVNIDNLFRDARLGQNSFFKPIYFTAGQPYKFKSNFSCLETYCGGYLVNNWVFDSNTRPKEGVISISEPNSLALFLIPFLMVARALAGSRGLTLKRKVS